MIQKLKELEVAHLYNNSSNDESYVGQVCKTLKMHMITVYFTAVSVVPSLSLDLGTKHQ